MSRDSRPSSSPSDSPGSFLVADWTVHPDLNRLVRGAETIAIEPRVMQVLVSLARRPGEVLTRDALLDEVWGDLVIQEEALTHAISRLRRVFGDEARDSRFIETIRKRGYRLIAPVIVKCEPARAVDESTAVTDAERRAAPTIRLSWAAAGALAVLVSLFLLFFLRDDLGGAGARDEVLGILEGAPLTSYPGEETMPAVSPDGTRVAFCRVAEEGEDVDLFLKQLKAETPLRLTDTPGQEHSPSWSPDGSELAFLRDEADGTSVLIMPAAGGPERKVFESSYRTGIRGVDWHPPGDRLILAVRRTSGGPFSLHSLSLESGELRPLPVNPDALGGDSYPAASPDGKRIAFVSSDLIGQRDLYCLDALDGDPRRLTFGEGQIRGLDWTADSRAVVFSSGTAFAGEFRLWRVDVESGERTWLPTRGRRSIYPSIATLTDVLVYAEETYRRQVRRAPVDSTSEPEPFVRSSHSEYDAHYSPSGSLVAFVSTRTGNPEVYICNQDGEEVRQVTSLGGPNPEFIQWSRDEKRVAYDLMDGSRSAVHVTDIERGVTRPVTRSSTDEILHSWSRDGTAIYLRGLRDGEWRSLRASLETGETEEILPYCTYMVADAPDSDTLYYVRAGSNAVWRMPLDSRQEEVVFEVPDGVMQCYWKASTEGIFFYRRTDQGPQLAVHDLRSGETRTVCPIPPGHRGLLDVASDGSSLLYDQVERIETDLVRVEPFRASPAN